MPRRGDPSRFALLVAGLLALGTLASAGGGASATIVPPGASCVVDTLDLLGWWRAEGDLAGEIGPDLTGTAAFGTAAVGQGLVLGASDTVEAVGFPTVSSGLTVEMWVSVPVGGMDGRGVSLLSRWDFPGLDDSARAYELAIDALGNLVWSTDETTLRRPLSVTAPAPALLDGDLHHVAATWSPTEAVVYLDGSAIATAPSQGGALNPATTTPLRIGRSGGLGDGFRFTGSIDEPAISGRALSAAEIGRLYDAGASGRCVPPKLLASDGSASDQFGTAVAVDGDTVVVGAPQDGDLAAFGGSAYVYERTAPGIWTETAKLTALDTAAGDLFGAAVAVDGDTVVVGAYGDDDVGSNSGSVYVFTRSGGVWSQEAKLVASDGVSGDWFGFGVSVSGESVAVGAQRNDDAGTNSGSAYVFARNGGVWSQEAKLVASDGAVGDLFGSAVSIDADSMIVGAPQRDGIGADSGSAYVFVRTGATWSQQTALAGAQAGDLFGDAVDISGDSVVVGAHLADVNGSASGAAHVFVRSGTSWSAQAVLLASDGTVNDDFGAAVAIDGDQIVVGAPFDDSPAVDAGAAYVFTRDGVTWNQSAKLRAKDAAVSDRFGRTVALSGDVALAGASAQDERAGDAGAAYLFVGI